MAHYTPPCRTTPRPNPFGAALLLGGLGMLAACAPPSRPFGLLGAGRGLGSADTGYDDETAQAVDTPADSAMGGDSGPETDTGDLKDGDDDDGVNEVCYLGADEKSLTCLPTVAYDPAWGSDYTYPPPLDDRYVAPARYIDLQKADAGLALAPNFVMSEVMQEWKGRYGLFQPHTIVHLQNIRDAVGGPVTVNSGYRNPAYNASVGGVSSSRHMFGDAVDIAASGASLDRLGDLCDQEGAGYVGFYESHVHCDWRDDPLETAFWPTSAVMNTHATLPTQTARLVRDSACWTAPAEGWDEGEPLREWVATDAAGYVLAQGTGRCFAAPAGTAAVAVTVGRALSLRVDIGG